MAAVIFDGVTKRYGDVVAVDDLDLTIDHGEFMVLLGPSGCGKTTALRMIAGLEEISDGVLQIGDRVVNHVDPRDRDVAMVFQSYALYPHMTVSKNIESPLITRPTVVEGSDQPRKLTKAERAERIAEAARMLDLAPYLDRKPAALSGGQRQRVALARAVVSRPAVYLMDEPLSNLDAKLRAQTRAELVDLHQRFGTTIVYVTHDQIEAMTMATRIAIMSQGKLQQVGTPRDVYDAPANLFVAQFIGTPPMNTAPGKVSGDAVVVGESRFRFAGRHDDGRDVVVGVRPEHLTIGGDGAVKGVVRHVEWLGYEALVTCEVGADAANRFTLRQDASATPPAVGDTVPLQVAPERVHVFDAASTERLGG
ncbi:MAG: ABC transporter ATP-binding protein [Acidimicrobiia bacterium]|nr:ABC transporter ATP-binding protein [Acidimicrobiia bacterium]